MTLYTYTVRYDDGAAPNPFNGMCTLAICKPAIRRVAQKGDWIVGLGSKNAPSKDLSGCLVYAMKVEEVLSLRDYDRFASIRWPHRIPDTNSLDMSERLGDCIYDYSDPLISSANPIDSRIVQRKSVHGEMNRERDLKGMNVLISRDFYYFGNRAKPLPATLAELVHQNQGHRGAANNHLLKKFERWIRGLGLQKGQLYGWPDLIIDWTGKCKGYGRGYGAPGWLHEKRLEEKRLGKDRHNAKQSS